MITVQDNWWNWIPVLFGPFYLNVLSMPCYLNEYFTFFYTTVLFLTFVLGQASRCVIICICFNKHGRNKFKKESKFTQLSLLMWSNSVSIICIQIFVYLKSSFRTWCYALWSIYLSLSLIFIKLYRTFSSLFHYSLSAEGYPLGRWVKNIYIVKAIT